MLADGCIGLDRLFELAFRPSIDVVWDGSVANPAKREAMVRYRGDLIRLTKVESRAEAHDKGVAGFERDEASLCYAIQFEDAAVGRPTVVQAIVNDGEVKAIVSK